MFINAILSIAGFGFACWFVFSLAVYALPFFAGMTGGLAAYHYGSGPLGAIIVGLCAGAATLVLGQFLLASLRSPLLRAAIAAVFAIPATIAGYHLMHGLSDIGGINETWRQIFSYSGGLAVGAVAWMRVGAHRPDEALRPVASVERDPIMSSVANDV